MEDGEIELDSLFAKGLGFTSDKFYGYLWKKGTRIIISVIESKYPGRGHLKRLFDNIERLGYTIAVPTPSNRMRAICEIRGMNSTYEYDSFMQCSVELMVKTMEKESDGLQSIARS